MEIRQRAELDALYPEPQEGIREDSPELLLMKHIAAGEYDRAAALFRDRKQFTEAPPAADAPGYSAPFGDGPPPLYTDRIGKNVYLSMIFAAVKHIYITTPYLICDYELLNALRLAAKRGVDVRIITPHIPDKKAVFLMTRSNYLPLVQDGVKVFEYTPGFIHAKNFLIDGEIAVCGSINLDYRSLVHNFECAVWMLRTECIPAMERDFLETEDKCQRVTRESAILPWWERLPAE